MWDLVWRSLAIGIGGTAVMDVWSWLLHAIFGVALPNMGFLGRWFAHLAKGTFFHKDISLSPSIPNETAIGWLTHYAIGIIYAGALVVLAGPAWTAHPTFLPALTLGLVTVGAGWYILQPGMGAGWAASLRPDATRVRILSILGHTVFASGMFATALLIQP